MKLFWGEIYYNKTLCGKNEKIKIKVQIGTQITKV